MALPKRKSDVEFQREIEEARQMVAQLHERDANEAETRRRIDRIFDRLLAYDPFEHLTREHAVRGAGETEHVDFAIQIESDGEPPRPVILVELKRVGVNLRPKHLKQVTSYAINTGCDWILLTNGRQWRIYHVEFGKPPETRLLYEWDLLEDEPEKLVERFRLISYRSVRRGRLEKVWEKRRVLDAHNLLGAIFSERSVKVLRRELRRSTGVLVPLEDVISGVRRLLNENALSQMESMQVTFASPEDDAKSQGARKAWESRRVKLHDLLEAGLIAASAILFADCEGRRLEARVQSDGTIEYDGKRYPHPSKAAVAARAAILGREVSTNGWRFWQCRDDDGVICDLAQLRRRYRDDQPEKERPSA